MSTTPSLLSVDLEKLQPLRAPGFSSPKGGVGYHDPKVQEVLELSYGPIFPKVLQKDGQYLYESRDDRGRETCTLSEPVRNISDIPKGELLRVMEGWIKCRRLLQLQDFPNRIESILLNFKVPNPRRSLESYRIYQDGERTRLHVLWGFEANSAGSVSVEKALSILLGVPESHMHSILSASMPTPGESTSTVPVSVNLDTAAIASLAQQQLNAARPAESRTSTYVIAGLVGVILVGCGMLLPGILNSGDGEVVEIKGRDEVRRERNLEQDVKDYRDLRQANAFKDPMIGSQDQHVVVDPQVAGATPQEELVAVVTPPAEEPEPLEMTGGGAEHPGDEGLDLGAMAGAAGEDGSDRSDEGDGLLDQMTSAPAAPSRDVDSEELNMIINS
ncbi:hypothetical protein [Sulfuriroseicoccus oceanibius]|uniref:Uncharacterized protein n=1 Tax=Sulfuriroseicoccus oceanibius TaxID=2707525 RepID=A0A6B3LF07_9BACT|nr:hypothetical protein [Sulfuriroseicoccus oceanibius]QQL44952.1 hypothetical protein G3M56_013965 [Sulfuriroseicoccus oceanibius]